MSTANHWRRDYDRIVQTIITSSRGITVAELCRSTGLLSDEISDVTDRLLAALPHAVGALCHACACLRLHARDAPRRATMAAPRAATIMRPCPHAVGTLVREGAGPSRGYRHACGGGIPEQNAVLRTFSS
jgi:hypothetical protein